jgi:hypothetical protein
MKLWEKQLLPFGEKNKLSMEKIIIKGRENWNMFTGSIIRVED